MIRPPTDIPSAILTQTQFRSRLGVILDRIEEELDGTAPDRAPIRRRLRISKDDLLSARDINLLFPPTRNGVAALVLVGLATSDEAARVLAVPAADTPPQVEAPAGAVSATWDGWEVWAIQCPPGAEWVTQTFNGDVTITHPDYLVTHKLGGAQARARSTEIVL